VVLVIALDGSDVAADGPVRVARGVARGCWLAAQLRPAVVVIVGDVRLLAAVRRVRAVLPSAGIVVLVSRVRPAVGRALVDAGVGAYLRERASAEVISAVAADAAARFAPEPQAPAPPQAPAARRRAPAAHPPPSIRARPARAGQPQRVGTVDPLR